MKKNRTALSVVCAVFALILLVIKELFFSDSVNFYVTSIAILLLSLLPFFISFEHKKNKCKRDNTYGYIDCSCGSRQSGVLSDSAG